MRDSILLGTLVAAVFAGCSLIGSPVNEDNFFERWAVENCRLLKDCYAGYFYADYDDIDDCVDEQLDLLDDYQDYVEDECDFDDDNGRDCVSDLRSVSCEDIYDDIDDVNETCADVWDC